MELMDFRSQAKPSPGAPGIPSAAALGGLGSGAHRHQTIRKGVQKIKRRPENLSVLEPGGGAGTTERKSEALTFLNVSSNRNYPRAQAKQV